MPRKRIEVDERGNPIGEPDDLSNLDDYGDEFEQEAVDLGGVPDARPDWILVDATHRTPGSHYGCNFELIFKTRGKRHLSDTMNWVHYSIPLPDKDSPAMLAEEQCPLDFDLGVWIEFEAQLAGRKLIMNSQATSLITLRKLLDKMVEMLSGNRQHETQDGARPTVISGIERRRGPVISAEERQDRIRHEQERTQRQAGEEQKRREYAMQQPGVIDYGFTGTYRHIDGEEYPLESSTIQALLFDPITVNEKDSWEIYLYYKKDKEWKCKNDRYGIKIFDEFAKSVKACLDEQEWEEARIRSSENKMPYLLSVDLEVFYASIPSQKNPGKSWNKYTFAQVKEN